MRIEPESDETKKERQKCSWPTVLVAELASAERSELAEAFSAWLGLPGRSLEELAASASAREGAQQTYQVVAVLGFAAHADVLSEEGFSVLQTGLRRLAGREIAIDGVPAPVCSDAVGVLGVALGTRAVAPSAVSDAAKAWLARFLKSSYSMERMEDWQRGLFAVSDQLLGSVNGLTVPATPSAADLRVALRAKGMITENLPPEQEERDEAEALSMVFRETMRGLGCYRAALRLAALEWARSRGLLRLDRNR